jgi:predicted branched-subunit amino acid permease
MLDGRPLLFIAPAVAIGFCAYSFKRASSDTNVLLGAVLALVLAVFFTGIAFTVLLPWVPHT